MPETMVISCPECKTKIKAPESAIGKKIRCKDCQHVFVIKLPEKSPPAKAGVVTAEKKGPPTKPKPAEVKKPATPVKKEEAEDPDLVQDRNPYGLKDAGESYRCPQCAAAMESEDSIVCLNCGFNTRTRTEARTRRLKEVTGNDKFMWLLPGILCAVGTVLLIGYAFLHHFAMPSMVFEKYDKLYDELGSRTKAISDEDLPLTRFLFHPAGELWLGLMSVYACVKMTKFAIKRLIYETEPPEEEIEDEVK